MASVSTFPIFSSDPIIKNKCTFKHPFVRKFSDRNLMVKHFLPCLNSRDLAMLLRALCSGLSNQDRMRRVEEQALSTGRLYLDQLMEYLWYSGKTLTQIAANQSAFTRSIRHLDLCSFEYYSELRMHPLIATKLKSQPEDWDIETLREYLVCFPCLQSLDLSGRRLSIDAFDCLPELCPSLERLIAQDANLSDEHLFPLGGLRFLQELDLEGNVLEGETLPFVLKTCTRLQFLNLSETTTDNDTFLQLAPFMGSLHRLELRDNPLEDSGLQLLATYCPNLLYLDIRRTGFAIKKVTLKGILQLAAKCKKLETFHFVEKNLLSNELLQEILPLCPSLTKCDLSHATKVSDKGLEQALFHCPRLSNFTFSNTSITNVGFQLFKQFAFKRPKLLGNPSSINVIGTYVTTQALLDVPAQFPKLCFLDFESRLLTDDLVIQMAKAGLPMKLANRPITDKGLEAFLTQASKNQDRYRTLDLTKTRVTEEGLMKVPRALPQMHTFSFDRSLLNDSLLQEILTHCKFIQMSDLSNSDVTDLGLQFFLNHAHPYILEPGLELDLRHTKVTPEVLCKVPHKFPHMRKFLFNRTHLTDSLMEQIAIHCSSLQELEANSSSLTDKGVQLYIRYAAEHPVLLGNPSCLFLLGLKITPSTLILAARLIPWVQGLVFNSEALNDEALIEITSSCTHLTDLSLDNSSITDVGLKAFTAYAKRNPAVLGIVPCLSLKEVAVTMGAIEELIQSLPELRLLDLSGSCTEAEFKTLQEKYPDLHLQSSFYK